MKRRHLALRARVTAAAGVLVLVGGCGQAAPEGAAGMAVADVALYEGPDRLQRLIDGAKREGRLTVYTSAQTSDLGPVVDAFEEKYGITATIWRAGSEAVLNRVLQESRAGRHTVDVVETNGPELESLHREQLLQRVSSPHHANLIAPALRPHGEWVGTRLNVFVQAYNTNLVKKAELPNTWEDLLDPKWKGRLGIEAEDSDWLAGVFGEIGEEQGRRLFQDIVATNGVSTRKGHTLLTQLVVSGEVPLALTVYNYKAEQLKRQGVPIDWFTIGNAIARPNGVAVVRTAPHPHAAALFYDFELSEEGQQIIAMRDFVPTSRTIDTPLNKVPMIFVDARVSIDEYDKWQDLYTDLFGAGR
ncbi:MAG: extracellular solute-binding protein [Acidobacteria bacterium]|nr:extracellular solute-binding protein [Acidobacteriota bacterium]